MVVTGHEEGGRMVDADCEAHLMIDEVDLEQNDYGTSVKCKMSILGCTDPSQVGKSVTEFFKVDGKAAGMFLNVSEAAGLITAAERKEAQDAGRGMDIDETQLKGRQICARITMKPNLIKDPVTGKNVVNPEKPGPYPRIGFDTFGVWSKKAEAIPKDMQFANMVPKPQGQQSGQGGQQGGTPPASQPAPQTHPPQGQLPAAASSDTEMNW